MAECFHACGCLPPSRLVGVSDLARRFKVGPTTVSNWYARRARNEFPELVTQLAMGPVWDFQAVEAWHLTYVPSKGGRAQRG